MKVKSNMLMFPPSRSPHVCFQKVGCDRVLGIYRVLFIHVHSSFECGSNGFYKQQAVKVRDWAKHHRYAQLHFLHIIPNTMQSAEPFGNY